MRAKVAVLSLLLPCVALCADAPVSYKGTVKFPVDLYAADGSHLEPGEYEIEVKPEAGRYTLVFSQNEKIRETVKGEELRDDASDPPGEVPLLGTNYLRSSADPVGTEAERHTSKTGRAQYEEENRSWKGELRVYRSTDNKALLLFYEKLPGEHWKRTLFELFLSPRPKP
jgi:hypothetical protein